MTAARAAVIAAALLLAPSLAAGRGQPPPPPDTTAAVFPGQDPSETPTRETQLEQLWHAVTRLPLAAGLACVLAVRPRRRGAAPRKASVVQTQIILAIVGAVVMLVVGQSLARAFGIVGAAGLVRYRAKIDDPKDAGVMLSTLAVGLACGVGLWMLAIFGTVFILAVLSTIESFERAKQAFLLTVKTKDPSTLKPKLEELFARNRVDFELRTASNEEVCYEVKLPLEKKTDRMSNAILKLAQSDEIAVEWEEKKSKK
jgi:uncharacterized membrane protein YhiD involved in acid resistance